MFILVTYYHVKWKGFKGIEALNTHFHNKIKVNIKVISKLLFVKERLKKVFLSSILARIITIDNFTDLNHFKS
jgi:hypothetical protein